jgi:hypothetical protein
MREEIVDRTTDYKDVQRKGAIRASVVKEIKKMAGRKRGSADRDHYDLRESGSESGIEGRVERAIATITAHSIMTEVLMHTICFEVPGISRTHLLNIMEIVYNQLEAGLGCEDEIVLAFGEQRDSLRSLLVSSVIQAEMQSTLDKHDC